eukprot:6912335-Pyramimonas_sp.AAC.1
MPPRGKRLRLSTEGVQNDEHTRAAVDELKKAAPITAPRGLAASGDVTAPSGSAASGDVAVPSGPAASGYVAATRAAQPSRGPVLAPAKGVQDVKTP